MPLHDIRLVDKDIRIGAFDGYSSTFASAGIFLRIAAASNSTEAVA